MKKLSLSCAVVALVASGFASAVTVGSKVPDVSVTDINGKTHQLSDFKGKTVVLEWNNPECPFVKKHYGPGNMQAQQKDATANDVVWLTVNSSAPGKQGNMDAATAKSTMVASNAAFTAYALDPAGDAGRAFDAKVTPHMYIIDGDGVVRYNGAIDSNPSANPEDIADATQYVKQGLAELASGKPISVPTSKAYGCSVKY